LIPLPVLETGSGDGEKPMQQNVEVYVREPEVGIGDGTLSSFSLRS